MRRNVNPRRRVSAALAALLLVVLPAVTCAQGPLGGFRRSMQSQSLFRQGRVLYEAREYDRRRARLLDAVALDESA